MDFQLVLQFHGESLRTFSQLEKLEENVTNLLGVSEAFDGLDAGGHGANLFIYTDNPKRTFELVRPLLKNAESAAGFTAAYRTVAREQFHTFWPAGSTLAFNLR